MAKQPQLKDNFREQRLFINRCVLAVAALGVLTLVLVARMIFLQIISHKAYSEQSRDNRIKLVAVPPTRGLIYDRNGVLLAGNLPSFTLTVTPELVDDLDQTLDRLAALVELSTDDLSAFRKRVRRERKFSQIALKFRLSEEEVARVFANRHTLPGVEVNAGLIRHYPYGTLTSHLLGYVGRINEKELKSLDPSDYRGTTHIGKSGIEKSYEDELHGTVGMQQIETNALGRQLRIIDDVPPVAGTDLYLSVDIEFQQRAYDALGDEKGAVVAIEPSTGDVLAFVSKPSFDANLFVNGISSKEFSRLNSDQRRPLFNRAIKGRYPPGSTIKPIVGLAGLEAHVITKDSTVYCPGFFSLPNSKHRYRDWKRWGHGRTDLNSAIAESCDVYFYDMAIRLGIDEIHAFMTPFGFGQKTGIDLPQESAGLLPSREWKRAARNEPWYPGETVIAGIGQGFMQTTPLQLASSTATVAMRGQRFRPKLLYARSDAADNRLSIVGAIPQQTVQLKQPSHWNEAIQAMINVVHGPTGTARGMNENMAYLMAGKTGTAQVYGLAQEEEYDAENTPKHLRDHALFVAFAPADAPPKIALAVVVENGGSGGSVAAPIARKIIDSYFDIIHYERK